MRKGLIKSVPALLALLMGLMCLLPPEAEALRDRWSGRRLYTLQLGVDLSYRSTFGDTRKEKAFAQKYRATFTGYYIDPRLVSYKIGASVSTETDRNTFGDANFTLRFFDRINPKRGLKYWKNIPRPIVLRGSYSNHGDYSYYHYGISMNYTRQGDIIIGGGKKLIEFEDEETRRLKRLKERQENAARYRIKRLREEEEEENGDNNGNGNGDNNNNNNNRRRRNNLNNNNNNNNSNWTNNNRENRQVEAKERGVKIRFPWLFLDFNKSHGESKTGYHDATNLNFRAKSSSFEYRGKGKERRLYYRAEYFLRYNYRKNGSSGSEGASQHLVDFSVSQRWRRLAANTQLYYHRYHESKEMGARTAFSFDDSYKNYFSYFLDLVAEIKKDDEKTEWNAAAGGVAARDRTYRLTNNETARYRFKVDYRREQGSENDGTNAYSASLTGDITSRRQLRHADLTALVSTAYAYPSSGIPLSVQLGARSRTLGKLVLDGRYNYSTAFPSSSSSHDFSLNARYRFSVSLDFTSFLRHSWTTGGASNVKSTTVDSTLTWRRSRSEYLTIKARMTKTSSTQYELGAVYRRNLTRRSSLVLDGQWRRESGGLTEKDLAASYAFSTRKFTFSADYGMHMSNGSTYHTMMVKVTRTWGWAFRRLW